MDMALLQTDYVSLPARQLVPLLKALPQANPTVEAARQYLLKWDYKMEMESVAATIYNAWEANVRKQLEDRLIPK